MRRLVVLVVVLALAGCSRFGHHRREYPDQVQGNFVTACMQSGAPYRICVCEIEALEERYTLTEFLAYDSAYTSSGVLSPDVLAVMSQGAADC